jgi:hypothetical protein
MKKPKVTKEMFSINKNVVPIKAVFFFLNFGTHDIGGKQISLLASIKAILLFIRLF